MSTYNTHPISCHDLPITSIVTYGFLVDAVLDDEKLKEGLDLVISHWPIIGSRIAVSETRAYVYQTPTICTTPGYTFDSRTIEAFSFPSATEHVSLHPLPDNSIYTPPAHLAHANISGYASTQQPVLHVQITRSDGGSTAIGLTIPHCFADAGGVKEIIIAWTEALTFGSLRGDSIEDTLFLEHIGEASHEIPPGLWINKTSKPAPISGQTEARWIFMPNDILASYKKECMEELKESLEWVSEGDVLYAWLVKAICSTADALPTVLTIPVNLRGRLPELPHPYLHNATHAATHVFPSEIALKESSLVDIAISVRRAIQNTTPDLIQRHLAYKTAIKGDGTVSVTNYPAGVGRVTLSNWLGLDWAGSWMNFGKARTQGTGKILWADVQFATTGRGSPSNRSVSVACRRDARGVWLWVSLADWRWKTGVFREMVSRT